ncbi:MAG: methyltransferase domain-containing protein [Pyrinomonadaceae bacterium]
MPEEVELVSPEQEHKFIETCFELASESHFWFKWRFESFLQQVKSLNIPLESELHVLDVGAGNGVVRSQVESATKWVVDITDLHIEALRSSDAGRGKTFYYDILQKEPSWEGKYDAIILFDVLEHIETPSKFIDAVLFHIKEGGYLFINVPALPLLFSRYDEVQGHYRRYKIDTLSREFAGSPAEIVDARYWGWINLPLLLVRRFWLTNFSKNQTDQEVYRRGFAPPSEGVNAVLTRMMRVEHMFPTQKITGSSILMAIRKTER